MAEQVYELTLSGIQDLEHELDHLKTKALDEVAERLKEARSLGDLSENSEYDDAKTAQAEVEMRIAEIEKILKSAKIIDDTNISNNEVSLGSKVTILDVDLDLEQTYLLVSQQEEDIFKNKISSASPVGAAILGKKKGSKIKVKTPSGQLEYKILKIEKPQA